MYSNPASTNFLASSVVLTVAQCHSSDSKLTECLLNDIRKKMSVGAFA
jgi:hypothetical protein